MLTIPALIKQAVWGISSAFRTPDVCGLQLIQLVSQKVDSTASRTDPPSTLLLVIVMYMHEQLRTSRDELEGRSCSLVVEWTGGPF
jgi:hypothetical protein